ncbi:ATP-binding sensor histidine kinase [Polyangium sp. 6x1]|uniref:sensor histidine kinase n=1 Tax=Polyangium sp. 6x1 TaxID=3042689 RepID=UPI00248224AD|nr:ATP-binding sensor histidine kinase [Polyangium sp. 6x1]MDI1451516.1 trifunctional serine/threonine-protein kinase/ATP-binding protein/sensor histidine kinase [Polyangium sp. 6x1]
MYTLTETLSEQDGVGVYRGRRDADQRRVVIKVLDPRRCRPRDLERLKNEYEIGRALDIAAVARPLALEFFDGSPALVTEDAGSVSLRDLLGAPMSVERFLPLAVAITQAVAEVHARSVIHKDLKPANILVHPATFAVQIADFGIASRLPREPQAAKPLRLIEGSLPYLSPEQTGRMNRAIDHRSDLYSLGVTFYEMLTGRLPFQATDLLEWVHCHIARAPAPPSDLVPSVPEVLSRIVMKLLAKGAEERYQSAAGLGHDLARCLASWQSESRIEPFALGARDVLDRFQIPQKLYGRDQELAALLGAFERVAAEGTPELVLVSGYSGVGKSSLVHELYKPVFRERGLLVSGKFDQFKRDIPYATIAQAFRDLVSELLAQSDERIEAFRQRLRTALGVNGQLIVDVIPQIELVIGRQSPVPELPLAEAQNRFHMVFRQLASVFAREEHPVAVFLDDLQWVDSASLELLEHLVTHPDTRYLLLIGAYRDNEVHSSHPLMIMLDEVRKRGVAVRDIVLAPLSPAHVAELVADTVQRRPEEVAPLAELVHEKTAGNPFFAIQFLTTLHQEQLLTLDPRSRSFRFDVAKIRAKNFSDNVIDLMVAKLRRLAAPTRDAMKLAACVGNIAETGVLSMIDGCSESELHAALWEAIREGLVLRLENTYKFLHDRVREAAYSLIPEDERALLHLRIGRLLVAHASREELEERIFDIANQLNLGASLLSSRSEKDRVAELNLIAGRKAKASTAYLSAITYFSAGSALLAPDSWEHQYDLTFGLHLERAESEFVSGGFAAAEELLAVVLRHARTNVDRARATTVKVYLHAIQDQYAKAVEAAIEGLAPFGIVLWPHPGRDQVDREYERIWQMLGERRIEDLIDLPAMTDPEGKAALDILVAINSPALYTDENLVCLTTCHSVNLSLKHGNAAGSSFAYVFFGMLLGPEFGQYRMGFRFGKLGYDLVEKRGFSGYKAKVLLEFFLLSYWAQPASSRRALVDSAFAAALSVGDLTFACYAGNNLITYLIVKGERLEDVYRESERALSFARKARFGMFETVIVVQQRLIQDLRGLTAHFGSFDGAGFDEAEHEAFLAEREATMAIAVCWYYVWKAQARFMAGDYEQAALAATKARSLLWSCPSFDEVSECHYYGALAISARYHKTPPEERAAAMATLREEQRAFRVWADNCAESFFNKYALLSAEIARIEGRDQDAMALYEQAIRSARENGFVQNEGISWELAARFYRDRGFELIADTYFREARACYARWGADGKVRSLDRLHPHLLERRPVAEATTLAVRVEQLDLLAVVKASQTISGEIVQENLIHTLLRVVLEQGGAQKAYLLISRGGALWIEAEATLDVEGAHARRSSPLPVESSGLVPASVVHYVRRTKERQILDDASAEAGRFATDEYIQRIKPKSVLCLPILRQAEVFGLLYLENNLVPGAFTAERLTALELVASQAAISLENARLLSSEQAARQAAEQDERRAVFLAEASESLGESLEHGQVLRRLAELCVRGLADWCVIDILENGRIRRASGIHKDPAKQPLLEELQRRYPPFPGSPHPASQALRTGEPLLLVEVTDATLRATCLDAEHERLLSELGTRMSMHVPLVARGQILGVVTLASAERARPYGPADLGMAEVLSHRAAIAIDNARLYSATQEAVQTRDEFLAVASHELRTPMTSLGLSLQSLLRAIPSERPPDRRAIEDLVRRACRQNDRMNRLIDELLDVSRFDAGHVALETTEVELGTLVREVVAQLELDLTRSRCPVRIHGDAAVVGVWDRSRLEQVVTNLLANAIKFGAGKPITIATRKEAGSARLEITDQGIGIAPDQQARIFERFGRAVSVRHYGGLGLGLYICRRIVEAHGGSIRVESGEGTGSTFVLELPCYA